MRPYGRAIPLLIFLILGTVGWHVVLRHKPQPVTVTVELRKTGFFPSVVHVPTGSTVIFTTAISEPFWPAANPHPTHTGYAGFDPQEPILPTRSWSFTFTKAGTFAYHDHLHPERDGTIIVGSDFDVASVTKKAQCEGIEQGARQTCYQALLRNTVKKEGLVQANALFRTIAQEDPNGCHQYAHDLGSYAFDSYQSGTDIEIAEESSWCGWGFWHGFLTKMQTEQGFASAKDFCMSQTGATQVETTRRQGNCFHGIGIGLVADPPPYAMWGDALALLQPALQTCDKVSESRATYLKNCYSGVFHAVVTYASTERYGFKVNATQPFSMCDLVALKYREDCLLQVAAKLGPGVGMDFQKTLTVTGAVTSISEELRERIRDLVLVGFFDLTKSDDGMQKMLDTCTKVYADARDSCVRALMQSLFDNGIPGKEYIRATALCARADLSLRTRASCFNTEALWIGRTYSEPTLREACTTIATHYKGACPP